MNKTPVSILQEMMVKQGMTPDYELIYDGGGSHVNTFTYRVTCDGLKATGTGRCKKDAKHEAAKAMLTEIAAHRNYPQLPPASNPTDSPSRSPFRSIPVAPKQSNAPFVNAIGVLQDLCAENNLKEPKYILTRDLGPPHARIFTIRCIVSNFTEDGTSTTKKLAKHDAAKKMVERIKGLIENKTPKLVLNEDEDETCTFSSSETNSINNAKEYYRALSDTTRKVNLGIRLSEYHVKWRDSLEPAQRNKILEHLSNILPKDFSDDITLEVLKETLLKLETALSEVNITVNMKDLAADNNYFMKTIELNTCPILTQIGLGKSNIEATWKALYLVINSVKLLLS